MTDDLHAQFLFDAPPPEPSIPDPRVESRAIDLAKGYIARIVDDLKADAIRAEEALARGVTPQEAEALASVFRRNTELARLLQRRMGEIGREQSPWPTT